VIRQVKTAQNPSRNQGRGVEKYLDDKWTARNEKDLQDMSEGHEKLINLILAEEEEIINAHKEHIDYMVAIIKGEMGILHEVDQPGSDVDDYTAALKNFLQQQVQGIMGMKEKLEGFQRHLRMEEEISKKFYKLQGDILGNQDY
jgi:kinesin family protein 2/24